MKLLLFPPLPVYSHSNNIAVAKQVPFSTARVPLCLEMIFLMVRGEIPVSTSESLVRQQAQAVAPLMSIPRVLRVELAAN